jgi:hypothetical protein
MTLTKETKNTVRYDEPVEENRHSFYVQKSVLGDNRPQNISVTITATE